MADVKKGSDLITTMGETEARLKKVERQLSVPRTTSSIITTAEGITTSSLGQTTAATLTTPDIITVVTTARCIIDFYFTFDYSWTWAGVPSSTASASIYLRDNETGFLTSLRQIDGGLFQEATGVFRNSTYFSSTFSSPDYKLVFPSPLWASAAGAHKFELRITTQGIQVGGVPVSTTLTLKNRALYARVTPF